MAPGRVGGDQSAPSQSTEGTARFGWICDAARCTTTQEETRELMNWFEPEDAFPVAMAHDSKVHRRKRRTSLRAAPLCNNPANVPRVTIKTGLLNTDGHEEELSEFMCDIPGCPNVAVQVLGSVPGLGLFSAVCQEHTPQDS